MSLYQIIGDIHAADRAPSSCTDSYCEDILDLLRDAMVLARLREAACVIWAGDVFHHKAPSRTSHKLVQALVRIIQEAPCEVLIVPGNHDLQNDRLESVEVTQPLGILFQAGARKLAGWGSPFKVFGVPWLGYCGDEDPEAMQRQRAIVRETLRPYREANIKPSEPYLVVAHAPLYPQGKELKWEYYPADWWAADMGWNGQVYYGHVHEPHGTYLLGGTTTADSVTFCNNGALSRGSLHEYNLTRMPGVTWWDDKTGKFEFQALPNAKPADQVFRLREAEEVKTAQGKLDGFLASVSATTLGVVSTETTMEYVRSRGAGKRVEDLVEDLLAYAQHEGKK